MNVFCSYNNEYDLFLKSLVKYIVDEHKDDLDLKNVREIELVKKIDGSLSDGRFMGDRIVLAERRFRNLPSLDLKQLKDNDVFNSIVGTIYHEMGHATDMVRMPQMYARVFEAFEMEDFSAQIMSAFLFLEYVAERRTGIIHSSEHVTFCKDFQAGEWNRYSDSQPDIAFYYLSKVLVYFLVRTTDGKERSIYLRSQDNILMSEYANTLERALMETYEQMPFDSIEKCAAVKNVIEKYMPLFEKEYSRNTSCKQTI